MKAIALGLFASFFFAFTFVLNRQMDLAGGSWIWSASLRYFFMLPMLAALLAPRREMGPVLADIRRRPLPWVLWSTVGFGMFYAPLTLAAAFGPSWLVAASWQVTIVAGALLSPLFLRGRAPGSAGGAESAGSAGSAGGAGGMEGGRLARHSRHAIPLRVLLFSGLILLGIALIQLPGNAAAAASGSGGVGVGGIGAKTGGGPLLFVVIVLIAAFSYPLGNRKTMQFCDGAFTTMQRVFGMTLASMPFWLLLAALGLAAAGPPRPAQILQAFIVALSSGIIATLLFFRATDLVRGDLRRLAAVESTQAGEVLFTLAGSILVFGDRPPDAVGFAGLALVVGGMTMNSLLHGGGT